MRRRKKNVRRVMRRRSSAVSGIDTMNLISVIGGAVASKFLDKVIPTSINPKIVAVGKIGLGIVLPMISKDGKTKNLLNGVGSGMIAEGSVSLLKEFGVLSGVGADDSDMLLVSLEGIDDVPIVNGMDDISIVSGNVLADDYNGVSVLSGDDDGDDISGDDGEDVY